MTIRYHDNLRVWSLTCYLFIFITGVDTSKKKETQVLPNLRLYIEPLHGEGLFFIPASIN